MIQHPIWPSLLLAQHPIWLLAHSLLLQLLTWWMIWLLPGSKSILLEASPNRTLPRSSAVLWSVFFVKCSCCQLTLDSAFGCVVPSNQMLKIKLQLNDDSLGCPGSRILFGDILLVPRSTSPGFYMARASLSSVAVATVEASSSHLAANTVSL
jgi:hypothetical protein